MRTYIFGHTTQETALEVKDYPWGFRLRTSIFYWIETVPKKGDRFCSYTIDPKTGRKCAPKKSTFVNIGVMYQAENGHIQYTGVGRYTEREKVDAFIAGVGEQNLNDEQTKMLRQLRGEVLTKTDKITGDKLKDFTVKWESGTKVRITFDRPDGVSIKEIFAALKTIDANRLQICFANDGSAHICVRGGHLLGMIGADQYNEFIASDHHVNAEA